MSELSLNAEDPADAATYDLPSGSTETGDVPATYLPPTARLTQHELTTRFDRQGAPERPPATDTSPPIQEQPPFRTPGPFFCDGAKLYRKQQAILRKAIAPLRQAGLNGPSLLRALGEKFDARDAPEVGNIFFNSGAERQRVVDVYFSKELTPHTPDPPYPVVFLTGDPELAAFYAVFNRRGMQAAGIPPDQFNRTDLPKSWNPEIIQLTGPSHVLDALDRTPTRHALTVTPEMLAAARGANPTGQPLGGWVNVWLGLPQIRIPQARGPHEYGFKIHSAGGLVPMARIKVKFSPEMDATIVPAPYRSVRHRPGSLTSQALNALTPQIPTAAEDSPPRAGRP